VRFISLHINKTEGNSLPTLSINAWNVTKSTINDRVIKATVDINPFYSVKEHLTFKTDCYPMGTRGSFPAGEAAGP